MPDTNMLALEKHQLRNMTFRLKDQFGLQAAKFEQERRKLLCDNLWIQNQLYELAPEVLRKYLEDMRVFEHLMSYGYAVNHDFTFPKATNGTLHAFLQELKESWGGIVYVEYQIGTSSSYAQLLFRLAH